MKGAGVLADAGLTRKAKNEGSGDHETGERIPATLGNSHDLL